jgi:tRNA G18 (ribose-2'-O)-methylase SpoU
MINERRIKLKNDLDNKRTELAIGIYEPRFIKNIGTIIRTCNAFLVKEIVISSKNFNKKGTVNCEKWENIIYTKNIVEYFKENEYVTIALEQNENSINIHDYIFPKKCAIIVGNEITGIPIDIINQCDQILEIPQYGLVKSLNIILSANTSIYK